MNITSASSAVLPSDIDENHKDQELNQIEERVLHLLLVYPILSPSMIQIGLSLAAASWRPVVDDLVSRGLLKREYVVIETPTGRHQTYTRISLAGTDTDLAKLTPQQNQ